MADDLTQPKSAEPGASESGTRESSTSASGAGQGSPQQGLLPPPTWSQGAWQAAAPLRPGGEVPPWPPEGQRQTITRGGLVALVVVGALLAGILASLGTVLALSVTGQLNRTGRQRRAHRLPHLRFRHRCRRRLRRQPRRRRQRLAPLAWSLVPAPCPP